MSDRPAPRALSAALAAEYVGLSASTLHRLEKAGGFPRSVRLTPARVVWLREDLDAWLDAKAGKVREVQLDGWGV